MIFLLLCFWRWQKSKVKNGCFIHIQYIILIHIYYRIYIKYWYWNQAKKFLQSNTNAFLPSVEVNPTHLTQTCRNRTYAAEKAINSHQPHWRTSQLLSWLCRQQMYTKRQYCHNRMQVSFKEPQVSEHNSKERKTENKNWARARGQHLHLKVHQEPYRCWVCLWQVCTGTVRTWRSPSCTFSCNSSLLLRTRELTGWISQVKKKWTL